MDITQQVLRVPTSTTPQSQYTTPSTSTDLVIPGRRVNCSTTRDMRKRHPDFHPHAGLYAALEVEKTGFSQSAVAAASRSLLRA